MQAELLDKQDDPGDLHASEKKIYGIRRRIEADGTQKVQQEEWSAGYIFENLALVFQFGEMA